MIETGLIGAQDRNRLLLVHVKDMLLLPAKLPKLKIAATVDLNRYVFSGHVLRRDIFL